MNVQDIMTREVVSVAPETPITEVADIMFRQRFHGLPVMKDGFIVGIITESDFYIKDSRLFLPSFIDILKTSKPTGFFRRWRKKSVKNIISAVAKDIMTPWCTTIHQTMSLRDLLGFFKKTNLYTIPVTDNEGNLVGIVTQADLIKVISI